jgi:DNA mismatch repair protein MutL
MVDIIQLLPDSIANQIAAGEVVQRPASAVKELLENAIDAGATKIQLILKDAGRTLIQVIDNGSGMSETDARMCFERHATSKIKKAEDLFEIRTMGFRGEALASIAAVAQVELKSRKEGSEVGTKIIIEGSQLLAQEAESCPQGTSIAVKNLFFNIPARRNFLKDNKVEMKHITDDFLRVAIVNPDIHFTMHHNNVEIYHLMAGNLKQRIVGVFGQNYNKNLVPIQEETDVVVVSGFVGKPEFAKKTRGEQFFFINNRFVKSAYLHHAVMSAYEDVIGKDAFPFYVILMDIDPSRIDVNVHPTKTEIKFDDEKVIYNYLKVAIRHGLGQYSITPTLDFSSDVAFFQQTNVVQTNDDEMYVETLPSRANNSSNDTFKPASSSDNNGKNSINFKSPERLATSNLRNWQQLYEGLDDEFDNKENNNNPTTTTDNDEEQVITIESKWEDAAAVSNVFDYVPPQPYQVHNTYIVHSVRAGFLLIDQQAAHERILYERFLQQLESNPLHSQAELFPKTIELSPQDATLLKEVLLAINQLGFDLQEFGQNTFVLHAKPSELNEQNEKEVIEKLLEQYKQNINLHVDVRENLAHSMARNAAIKRGKPLSVTEMQAIVEQLFACAMPYKSPSDVSCFLQYDLDDLKKAFEA